MLPGNALSIQSYSFRKFTPVERNLQIIKDNGISDIQLNFGNENYPQFDHGAMKTEMDRLGITARSGHFYPAFMEEDPEGVIRIAKFFGMSLAIGPWLEIEDRPTDTAGWKALGARLERCRARLADAGLRVGWHNHAFEFEPLPDGSYPIEHLLGDNLVWAPDLAWVTIGEADPKAWLKRYAGRIGVVHVKDVAPKGENLEESGFADLGTGIIPWAELWPAAVEAGAELMILEHDNPSDFERFVTVSAKAAFALARAS